MSVEWKMSKEFVGVTGVTVRVNVLSTHTPMYSVEVGAPSRMGSGLSRHLGPEMVVEASSLMLDAAEHIGHLMGEHHKMEEDRLAREREKRARHTENVERRRVENRQRAGQRGGKSK